MNLIEALEAQGIEYRLHQSKENELFICCPFCVENGTTPDTRFRLGVNLSTGWMKCFNGGCGKASKTAEYTWKELQRVLDSGELESASRVVKSKKKVGPPRLPEDFEVLSNETQGFWGRKAYKYIRSRGIEKWQLERYGIGYSETDVFRYRILFPVKRRGILYGIVGRAFVKGIKPKYKNSVGDKVLFLCGKPSRKLILVEGCLDALTLERTFKRWKIGAVLGHSLTEKQLEQVNRYDTILLWYDDDEAGIQGVIKTAKQLEKLGKRVLYIPPSEGQSKDPDEMTEEEIWAKYRTKVPYTEASDYKLKVAKVFYED